MRRTLAPLFLLLLAGCGPRITATAVAGRTLMVTNGEQRDVTVQRIVANDADDRSGCVDTPAVTLGPGRTYTTTFFECDEVRTVRVETDAGTAKPSLDG